MGHPLCRNNYGAGEGICSITWGNITVGTSNRPNGTSGGGGGWTSVSSSLMDVETLGEIMRTGGWFSLPEEEDNGEANAEYFEWCRGLHFCKEDRETLMTFVTKIQPGRQFRFVKTKRREIAALRRERVKARIQVRDGKEKSRWVSNMWAMESIRTAATLNIND